MKRLAFFAFAFLILGLLAYVLRPHDSDVTNDWASSAQKRAMMSQPHQADSKKPDAASNTSTAGPTSAAKVADGRKPSTDGPETEAAALGYLQSRSKKAWDFKRDDFKQTIRTLKNGQLATDSLQPRDAGDAFVKFYAKGLFGVDPARVKFDREEVTDRTRLIYNEVVDGTPVYGASLSLFFENGQLTRVQNDLAQGELDPSSKSVPVQQAFDSYETLRGGGDIALQSNAANRTVLYANGRTLIYAYELVTKEEGGKGFHVLYDQSNQFVIQRRPSAIQ